MDPLFSFGPFYYLHTYNLYSYFFYFTHFLFLISY